MRRIFLGVMAALTTLLVGAMCVAQVGGGISNPSTSGGGGLYGAVMTTPPTQASTGLTNWLAQGSAAVADNAIGITVEDVVSDGSNRGLYRSSVPSTPYTVKALINITANSNTYVGNGIGFRDSVSGKIEYIFFSRGANSGTNVLVQNLSAINTWNSNVKTAFFLGYDTPIWLRIADNGTSVSYGYSLDGVNFNVLYTVAKASGYLGASGYNQLIWVTSTGSDGTSGNIGYASLMQWNVSSP